MTFATLSLAPIPKPEVVSEAAPTVSLSFDDDELEVHSLSVGIDAAGQPSREEVAPVRQTANVDMRVLELMDEVTELRSSLQEKDAELRSKGDELACLSASLLEKEKLLRGVCVLCCLVY